MKKFQEMMDALADEDKPFLEDNILQDNIKEDIKENINVTEIYEQAEKDFSQFLETVLASKDNSSEKTIIHYQNYAKNSELTQSETIYINKIIELFNEKKFIAQLRIVPHLTKKLRLPGYGHEVSYDFLLEIKEQKK